MILNGIVKATGDMPMTICVGYADPIQLEGSVLCHP